MVSYSLRFTFVWVTTLVLYIGRYLDRPAALSIVDFHYLTSGLLMHTAIVAVFGIPMIAVEIIADRFSSKTSQLSVCLVSLVIVWAIWTLVGMNGRLPNGFPPTCIVMATMWGITFPITTWYRRTREDHFISTQS
jgi:hypothetical protein